MDRAKLKHALQIGDMNPEKWANEETILLLWGLAADTEEPKQLRKQAKRALYLLRSKGVDVDGVKPHGLEKPSLPDTRQTVETAALSLPDSDCRSVISIAAVDTKTLREEAHDFLTDTAFGIAHHRVRPVSRRAFQRSLMKENGGTADFLEVPAAHALSRLRRALSLTPENPEALARLIGNFTAGEAGPAEEDHPVLALLLQNRSHIADPEEEKKLFTEYEIQRIALSAESTARFKSLIEEAKNSRLILGNRTPEQRVSNSIRRFCAGYFTMPRRRGFGDMLFDVALFYFRQGKRGYARILKQYAEMILNEGQDILQHPFVQYLTYKAFLMKG